jgi:hypothetical protein
MPKAQLHHPALSQIATTPEILRLLMANVSEEQSSWTPAPGRFSIAEVLEHLSHVEGHCFRDRVEKMLAQENPPVEDYDQNAYYAQGIYSGRDAEESFAHFEEQREDSIVLLSTLDAESLRRTAMHPQKGTFSLDNMLHEWAFHDLSHVRQIAELVRAQVYFPNLGKLEIGYTVKP